MTTVSENTVHPFEKAGLGKAPFHFVGLTENFIVHPDGSTQAAGCCDYCHTGIRNEYHIRSTDGNEFVVGCDCVEKLDRADNRLVADVVAAKNARERQIRRAKADAEQAERWERERPAREARFAEIEARQAKEKAEKEAWLAVAIPQSAWLAEALEANSSDFARSVAADLR